MSEEKKSFPTKNFNPKKNYKKNFKERPPKPSPKDSTGNPKDKKKPKETFVRVIIRKLPPSSTFNFEEHFKSVWGKIFDQNKSNSIDNAEKKYQINHYMPGKISRKRGPVYGSALVTIFDESCYDEFMQKCPSVVPFIEDDLDTVPEITVSLIQMPFPESIYNDPEEGKYESSPLFAMFKNQQDSTLPLPEKKVEQKKINPILEFLNKESRFSKNKKDKEFLKKERKEKLKKKEKSESSKVEHREKTQFDSSKEVGKEKKKKEKKEFPKKIKEVTKDLSKEPSKVNPSTSNTHKETKKEKPIKSTKEYKDKKKRTTDSSSFSPSSSSTPNPSAPNFYPSFYPSDSISTPPAPIPIPIPMKSDSCNPPRPPESILKKKKTFNPKFSSASELEPKKFAPAPGFMLMKRET